MCSVERGVPSENNKRVSGCLAVWAEAAVAGRTAADYTRRLFKISFATLNARSMFLKIMRETYEFRVVEDFAGRLFRDDEGKKLGSGIVRLVQIASDDPRL